jgi:hypothetical protein
MTAAELDLRLWNLLGTDQIRELRKTYDLVIIANNRERREKNRRRFRTTGGVKVRKYRAPKPPKQRKPRSAHKKEIQRPLTIATFRALPIQPYG